MNYPISATKTYDFRIQRPALRVGSLQRRHIRSVRRAVPEKEQALAQLHEEFDEGYSMYAKDFIADDIYEDLVRFSCQGAHDGDGESGCMWYLGATGKGSKPMWTFRPRKA